VYPKDARLLMLLLLLLQGLAPVLVGTDLLVAQAAALSPSVAGKLSWIIEQVCFHFRLICCLQALSVFVATKIARESSSPPGDEAMYLWPGVPALPVMHSATLQRVRSPADSVIKQSVFKIALVY
jgi:hypothetical protein